MMSADGGDLNPHGLDATPSQGLKGWIERMVIPALLRDELRLRAEYMQKKP